MNVPAPLFTANELAGALAMPAMRLSRLIRRGRIVPDFQTNQANLFKPRTAAKLLRKFRKETK